MQRVKCSWLNDFNRSCRSSHQVLQVAMRISLRILKSGLLVLFTLIAPQLALAEEDSISVKPKRSVSTYDTYNHGQNRRSSGISTLQSEYSMRTSDLNRAIKMGRRAVELDPDDKDARVALGEALYKKLKSSKKEDPALFNECVKTWLLVHRNLIGPEKGMNIKGIGIPGMQRAYEDEEHGAIARERLVTLCGRTPKMFETNKKYLDKVLQVETSVSAVMIKKSGESNENK